MRLKPSAYLILGMLKGGVQTGYAIKQAVDRSTRFFWAASLAQVYPELARLEVDGYITGSDEATGARPRRTYLLTEKGESALQEWLRGPRSTGFEFRDEGLLRLFFADLMPPDEAIELVRRLRRDAEERDRRFREEILPLSEPLEEQGYRFPAITGRLGADYYRFRAEWFARLEKRLTEATVTSAASQGSTRM
jgi:DNA-binding PadR family transcriptional regulator